jgi:hypothetical protein
VAVDAKVAKLVDDYVVNALGRDLDQLWVQDDAGCARATTPPLVHFLQPKCRWWNTESLHVLVAELNPPKKQFLRVVPIPILDQVTNPMTMARGWRAYMQIAANQFHRVAVGWMELKSVLSA